MERKSQLGRIRLQKTVLVFLVRFSPIFALLTDNSNPAFEAAFQGNCGRNSPCEQLCYELHDGTYECECKGGYGLRGDGYSCYEINATQQYNFTEQNQRAENPFRDILYQRETVLDTIELEAATNLTENTIPESKFSPPPRENVENREIEENLIFPSNNESSPPPACPLNCGKEGVCGWRRKEAMCHCHLGWTGVLCEKQLWRSTPRFKGRSWLSFPTLRSAYKQVHISLQVRPETLQDAVLLLASERDDMSGDYIALVLHEGFVEFRFECGSGVGILRSDDKVLVNEWNSISLYRHRWDAWLQLNGGNHIQGRSKGLFSRITFREPLFLGGSGNTTGIGGKLQTLQGFKGCIRHFEVNDHIYQFVTAGGDILQQHFVEECGCGQIGEQNCYRSVCPLGLVGDACDVPLAYEVPSFNGSSYLRYKSLGDDVLIWLELELNLKLNMANGVILYSGHRTQGFIGDFIALYVLEGYVYFSYDLGSGVGTVVSLEKISLGNWHQVRISRTGRLAIMRIDNQIPVETLSPGPFAQLSLPMALYLGGVPNSGPIPTQIPVHNSFSGCIQTLSINGRSISIVADALTGAHIQHCTHPCSSQPCGPEGVCIPKLDQFTCKGPPAFLGTSSFIKFTDPATLKSILIDRLNINVRFRLVRPIGLLLYVNFGNGTDLALGIRGGGALVLEFRQDNRRIVIVHNSSTLQDNRWHRIKAIKDGTIGQLSIDNAPSITEQTVNFDKIDGIRRRKMNSKPAVYVGGMYRDKIMMKTGFATGIEGCIADLVFNMDYRLNLINDSAQKHNIAECTTS